MDDCEFLTIIREGLLLILDAIERKINISPRTAEIRRAYKQVCK